MAEPQKIEQSGSREQEQPEGPRDLALPIGMLILSMLCVFGAWVLVVFGAWPGAVLLIIAAVLAIVAKRMINRRKPASMR